MTLILVYAFVFVAGLLISDVLIRAVFRSRQSAKEVNSRLRLLRSSGNQLQAYEELMLRRGLKKSVEDVFSGGWLARMYSQSGLEMTIPRRVAFFVLFFVAGWIVAAVLLGLNIFLELVFAVVFAVVVSVVAILMARRRRIQHFTRQLPDAIDVIVRSLQAGHPLNAAISLVAKEMADPIGSEFGMLNDQLSFGEPLESAMLNLFERVGAEELKLLTVTVTVQSGTGGNLAEILENLSQMIRDRIMLKAKIRAISAEGRMTAIVMGVFPFGLFLMIKALVPTYFDVLIETGWASTIVVICLAVMAVGMVILNRMVNFDF